MSGVILRRARASDAKCAGGLMTQFTANTPWLPQVHSQAAHVEFAATMIGRGWVTVAEHKRQVVGFIARDQGTVHALYVSHEARGRGIGTALLRAQQANCDRLELWAFETNTGARAFYRRHGFAETERGCGAGNDEGLPDIRLIWERAA